MTTGEITMLSRGDRLVILTRHSDRHTTMECFACSEVLSLNGDPWIPEGMSSSSLLSVLRAAGFCVRGHFERLATEPSMPKDPE